MRDRVTEVERYNITSQYYFGVTGEMGGGEAHDDVVDAADRDEAVSVAERPGGLCGWGQHGLEERAAPLGGHLGADLLPEALEAALVRRAGGTGGFHRPPQRDWSWATRARMVRRPRLAAS